MDNINLIRHVAWSFHKTTGIPYEDLFSEASLAYCEASLVWESQKGKKHTFIYVLMKQQLINYAWKEQKYKCTQICNANFTEPCREPVYMAFSDLLKCLTPETQKMVNVILTLSIPDELPPKIARGHIIKELREREWSWPKIWRNIKNLKVALNEK